MNIGFVGLGAMGALIVPRLMAAGHKVSGWNRSRNKAEPLIAAGMVFAATPRAVAVPETAQEVIDIVRICHEELHCFKCSSSTYRISSNTNAGGLSKTGFGYLVYSLICKGART